MAKTKNSVELAPDETNVINTTETVSETPQTEPEAKAEPVPVPDKMAELKNQLSTKWNEMIGLEAGSKEALTANLEVYKIQKQIEAEEANIRKAENDAKMVEQRNARVNLFKDAIEADRAAQKSAFDDNMSLEEKQKLSDEAKRTAEIVKTELLARYATSTPSKTASTNGTSAPKSGGTISSQIRELFIANRANNMTDTENVKAIIGQGYSRGTTGAVVLAYQKEIGEKE